MKMLNQEAQELTNYPMIEIDIDNISVIMTRIAVLTQQLTSIETFIHNFLASFRLCFMSSLFS